ncbi:Trehalose-phosphatase [Cucumispora dikerogammari]|nr:Trehalose-phosphatase [Cucumispora dikerogammari]
MSARKIFVHYRLPVTITKETEQHTSGIEKYTKQILNSGPEFTTNELSKLTLNVEDKIIDVSVFSIPASNEIGSMDCLHMGLLSDYTPENHKKIQKDMKRDISINLIEKKNMIPIYPPSFTKKDEAFGTRLAMLSRYKMYNRVYDIFDEEEAFYNNVKLCTIFALEIQKEMREEDKIFITSPELWMLPYILAAPKVTMCFYSPLIQPDMFLTLSKSSEIIKSWLSCCSFEFQSFKDQQYFEQIISRQVGLEIKKDLIRKQMFINPIGINFAYMKKVIETNPTSEIHKLLSIPDKETRLILNIVTLSNLDSAQDIMFAFSKIQTANYILVNCLLPIGETFDQLESDNLVRSLEYFSLTNPYIRTVATTTNILLYELFKSASALISLYHEKSILEFKRLTGKPVISNVLSRISSIPIPFTNMFFVNPKHPKHTSGVIGHVMELEDNYVPFEHIPESSMYFKKAGFFCDKGYEEMTIKKKQGDPIKLNIDMFIDMIIEKNESVNIYCDYDGTISEIVATPGAAIPQPPLLELLDSISLIANLKIISGRDSSFLKKYFTNVKYTIYAEHGAEVYEKGVLRLLVDNSAWIEEALALANFFVKRTPGLEIEIKKSSIAFHYRKCREIMSHQIFLLEKTLKKFLLHRPVEIRKGKKIIEVVPKAVNKGSVVQNHPGITICIGDDTTDEDMFDKCVNQTNMHGIVVGEHFSSARWKVSNVKDVIFLLTKLEKALREKQVK